MIAEMPLPPPPVDEEQPLPPPPGPLVMRGATEGPLKDLIPVLFDFETYVTKEINLDRMRLREYLDKSWVTALSLTIGFDQPVAFFQYPRPPYHGAPFDEFDPYPDLTATLRELAKDPKFVFVPYNAAFDIRVGRFKMNWTHPVNTWCALEGAMSAWPELPGGFGLGTVAETLNFPPELRKLTIDLRGGNYTQEEYKSYNIRDTEVLREVYIRQIARIKAREQLVGLSTQRQRRMHLLVNEERLNLLIKQLEQNAALAELEAAKTLTEDERGHVFNHGEEERKKELKRAAKENRMPVISDEDEALRSIRSKRLLGIVQAKFGDEINTTSMKKLSPVIAARNPEAASFLTNVNRANKMVSHRRRSTIFRGAHEVDVELGFARAHTGRFSSPSTGKGLNLHNIPKHDIAIAKPVRQTFKLPDDKVAVRGDLANVEYRVNGWMTQCDTIIKMFDPAKGGNLLTDPYMAGWYSMTGVQLKSKKDPVRQVSKSATLGLGFIMSAARYVGELLKVLADKKSGVTEETLRELITSRKWDLPPPGQLKFIISRTGCSEIVATASYHIHKLFNKAHPEFRMTANWLVDVVNAVASVGHDFDQARKMIDRWYLSTSAPNRDRIDLSIDPDETRDTCSVRVRCGPWVETVCWREPKLRPTDFVANAASDFKLTIRKAYGPSKIFTPSLALENVVQAGARNMLCEGILRLEKLGFMDYIHVHDELMLIVDKNPRAVLHARDNLLKVFGPGGSSPMEWAVLIKPDEVTVTESLYEDEADLYPIFGKDAAGEIDKKIIIRPGRWDMIEQNHPECLVGLP